ncbi:porin family protein [Photobacterium makurazakiensis]
MGVGYSLTDAEAFGVSVGYCSGLKLEYGYDFNHIAGAHVSYEQNKEGFLKGSNLKFGGDFGYAFDLEGASIKPFNSAGLYSYDENFFDDSGFYFGFGARALINRFYVDIHTDYFDMDDAGVSIDMDQFSFTLGMTF